MREGGREGREGGREVGREGGRKGYIYIYPGVDAQRKIETV